MIYPNNYEEKVGFTQIRKMLKEACLCPLGMERVDGMQFSSEFEVVSKQVRQTSEFIRILREEEFPDQNFFDVRTALRRIKIQNTYLLTEELFDIWRSLDSIDKIIRFFLKHNEGDERPIYPELSALAENIKTFPNIVRRISQMLDKYGEVKDSATVELMRIRQEKQNTTNSISHLLNKILREAKSDGLVEKDSTPTVRDGRLVIPVAPAMKRKINGIVHDESDSGRTVYIEPADVVEANNRIRELESEERREIIRILTVFTDSVRPYILDMIQSYEFLGDIDFIRAKAKFAIRTDSLQPSMTDRQQIDWSMAVHPILRMSLEKHDRKVVPLEIRLDGKQRLLLISGPNAGGKSVCLKTVGLLQYMLQCGMPIPVAESSVTGIFQNIMIDIGDEQSLENDLSTYSSHLTNMKMMMKNANYATLLLIDEFGGGTEPQIGGAIAEAVLKRFNAKKAFGVITTHYQNLKQYAQDTPGIVNGAMLYDRAQMQPLFQLRIGNPGSSFAVEIARKIGIPEDVIAEASELVGQNYISADKYLQDISRDKRYWENKRQEIHQKEKRLESTIQRYEDEYDKIHSQKREIIDKAKTEAQNLLQSSNAQIEKTIKDIKEAQAERERTKQIRQKLEKYKERLGNEEKSTSQRDNEPTSVRVERPVNRRENKERTNASNLPASDSQLKVGDYVKLKGQTSIGQILRISGNEALVAFGTIQTNQKLVKLEPSAAPKVEKRAATFVTSQTQDNIRQTTLNFTGEIDVRGMRADECLQEISLFVDDALVANVSRVRILHGTGNGILRQLIRQYLNTIPEVTAYRDELPQFGGSGITIVDFE
ncbi:MAG: Smr/MutS family protein [Bacteroidaceae bacterium]|nr:Smr/MutS family protein [Bacteroidaceae bacterium]